MFPKVQRKAQAEMDSVVGHSRLPVTADRDSMPYLNAVCKETLRWHPVAPLGLPFIFLLVSLADILFFPQPFLMQLLKMTCTKATLFPRVRLSGEIHGKKLFIIK